MIEQTSDSSPDLPNIMYRRGAAGQFTPVIRGTGIRVQTIVAATQQWELTLSQVAVEYDLSQDQVHDALAFYQAHRAEIDAASVAEQSLEQACVGERSGPR
jgi:uncharacterized protein (DUF433 family)